MIAADRLPHIDEHSATIGAGAERTWQALLRTVEASVSAGGASRIARLLGCAQTEAGGPRPLAAGSTVPGFRVEAATEPREAPWPAATASPSTRWSSASTTWGPTARDCGRRPAPTFRASGGRPIRPW